MKKRVDVLLYLGESTIKAAPKGKGLLKSLIHAFKEKYMPIGLRIEVKSESLTLGNAHPRVEGVKLKKHQENLISLIA